MLLLQKHMCGTKLNLNDLKQIFILLTAAKTTNTSRISSAIHPAYVHYGLRMRKF